MKKGSDLLKASIAVVASYIAMAIFIGGLCLLGFVVLGLDRFFQTDTYEVTTLWLGISVVISIVSSILGGYLCAAISGSMGACKTLAVIVFTVGYLVCFPKMREDTHVRAGEVPLSQVMNLAQMPVWMYVVTPALGAIFILIGARMRLKA
jgi:hypothetical protein